MGEHKSLIVYKESIFVKIKNFIKGIFSKREPEKVEQEINEGALHVELFTNRKKQFNEYISFKENKEEIQLIHEVRNNIESLWTMTEEELDKVEMAIKNRQKYVDKKIAKLKTDLMMKKQANI